MYAFPFLIVANTRLFFHLNPVLAFLSYSSEACASRLRSWWDLPGLQPITFSFSPLSPHSRKEETGSLFIVYKDTYCIMGALPTRFHGNLITPRRSHLQIPSPWGVRASTNEFWEDKHSAYNRCLSKAHQMWLIWEKKKHLHMSRSENKDSNEIASVYSLNEVEKAKGVFAKGVTWLLCPLVLGTLGQQL